MENVCFLNRIYDCSSKTEKLQNNGRSRILSIMQKSEQYEDGLHNILKELLDKNDGLIIRNHKSCVSKYTSNYHAKFTIRKRKYDDLTQQIPSKTRRKDVSKFDFKCNCLFCGKACDLIQDPKHPDRWRKSFLCGENRSHDFKDNILKICEMRNDELSNGIILRIDDTNLNLYKVKARYHNDCHKNFNFFSSTSQEHTFLDIQNVDEPFEKVIELLKSDMGKIFNTTELYDTYISNEEVMKSKRKLIADIQDLFQEDLLVISSPGMPQVIVFSKHAHYVLNMHKEYNVSDEIDSAVKKVAKVIKNEIADIHVDKSYYDIHIDWSLADKFVSKAFVKLLQMVHSTDEKISLQIGNMLTGSVKKYPTPLQLSLGVLIKEHKHLLQIFSSFGITPTYDEILRFRKSAAISGVENAKLTGVFNANEGLIQSVADNFDAEISSPNGKLATHSLAVLLTQPDNGEVQVNTERIPRILKTQMKEPIDFRIAKKFYHGPKKPLMPAKVNSLQKIVLQCLEDYLFVRTTDMKISTLQRLTIQKLRQNCENKRSYTIPTLKDLCIQNLTLISKKKANETLFSFFQDVCCTTNCPEFNGYCTKLCRQTGIKIFPKTKSSFFPLIDSNPSDPDTIFTAMTKVNEVTKECGQKYTLMTLDQQLYRVAVGIKWVYSDQFQNFILRMGGMHMLMSFCGCIGYLMQGTGLSEVLSSTFGGVIKMLSGKKFPQNIRALRMVTEELLRHIFIKNDLNKMDDLLHTLENISDKSRMAKLWLDCLIKPVFISAIFIKAEREGDWLLHLEMVREMIPYFFAANHVNYARYALYYLRCMENLPNDLFVQFMNGQHVMRHNAGLWNGIWSDLFIESSFMHYAKGPKGIIGITLKPETIKTWALGLHICSKMEDYIDQMVNEENFEKVQYKHKEEMISRIESDKIDRESIRKKLDLSINPFAIFENSQILVNIVTGQIASSECNVYNALYIGKQTMIEFEKKLPHGFNDVISKVIKTMSESESHIKNDKSKLYDTSVIFSRLIGLQSTDRSIKIEDALKFELAPIPTSMFEDCGVMRKSSGKSNLKTNLSVKTSQTVQNSCMNHIFIDGCAIFYHVTWPTVGTVADYIENFKNFIRKRMVTNIYLTFDRYMKFTTKDETRSNRQQSSKIYHLEYNMSLPSKESILTVWQNKRQLIALIFQNFSEDTNYHQYLKYRGSLFITGQNEIPIEISKGNVRKRDDMTIFHEEADTIIIQQVFKIVLDSNVDICVMADDTDIFVLLIYFYSNLKCKSQMIMMSTDETDVIDIALTVRSHYNIIPDLPAAHALTGCDTVARMNTIGKKTAIKVLKAGHGLPLLGNIEEDFESVLIEASRFISNCYSKSSNALDMTFMRIDMWKKRFDVSKTTAKFLSTLPPTTEAFKQNVLRAHLQSYIWKNALDPRPVKPNSLDYGFQMNESNDSLQPIPIGEGIPLAPDIIMKLIKCSCAQEYSCKDNRCSCFKARLKCTMFCGCYKETVNCQNS